MSEIDKAIEFSKKNMIQTKRYAEFVEKINNHNLSPAVETWETILQALEKQIPKKPTFKENNRGMDASGEYDIDFNACCPICGSLIGDYDAEILYLKFCSECGQAILEDWSDADEK